MAAIAEHLSCPETKILFIPHTPTDMPTPASVLHPRFIGYLGLVCGAVALIMASRAVKTISR
jgi:hypothetical protein